MTSAAKTTNSRHMEHLTQEQRAEAAKNLRAFIKELGEAVKISDKLVKDLTELKGDLQDYQKGLK